MVILAGGRGERFWPVSQPDVPKQFLTVFRKTPLITQTIQRIQDTFPKSQRVVIIPEELRTITAQYLGRESITIEPVRRNTAPAICLAAMILKQKHGDGIIHVMPADHIIHTKRKFIAALRYGEELACRGYLVTYGIHPDRPETGYGYVHLGASLGTRGNIRAYRGKKFTEKPSLKKAQEYLRSRTYLWNSGIFTFRIRNILHEIEQFIPEVFQGVAQYLKTGRKRLFERIPDISIDYGVMEKSKNLCIVKGDFTWDDVGSWLALERYFKKDRHGNISIGDAHGLETNDTIIYAHGVPVRTYGIRNVLIVVSPRGVLVCQKDKAPYLKNLLT